MLPTPCHGDVDSTPATSPSHNWGKNVPLTVDACGRFVAPSSLAELQEAVRSASHVRVLGSGHSFAPLCAVEAGGTLVSLRRMRAITHLDPASRAITCEGGATFTDVIGVLAPAGWALRNCASLPHITVAGALATGTHGSGLTPGMEAGLPSHCRSITFVIGDGSLVTYSRDDADASRFRRAVVSVGALGVVASITLDIVPAYTVDQRVYRGLGCPTATLLTNFLSLARSTDSFTTGVNVATGEVTLWLRYFSGEGGHTPPPGKPAAELLGLPLLTGAVPFWELGEDAAGVQTTRVGPWHDVPSFFMHDGRERAMPRELLQSEFFVPLADAPAAIAATFAVAKGWPGWLAASAGTPYEAAPCVFHCEIRVIPADGLGGLGNFGDRDSVSIHFTWGNAVYVVGEIASMVEDVQATLRPFHVRPHAGKLNTMLAGELEAALPPGELAAFSDLVRQHGGRKFVNAYVSERLVG